MVTSFHETHKPEGAEKRPSPEGTPHASTVNFSKQEMLSKANTLGTENAAARAEAVLSNGQEALNERRGRNTKHAAKLGE